MANKKKSIKLSNPSYTKKDIEKLCKGRTAEQKKVIKYFLGGGGCLSITMSDEEYDAAVMAKVRSMNFQQMALNKLGLDPSQVNEIAPVHFEAYYSDESKTYARMGRDKKWRSSAYQVSWIFFSDTQIYVYQYTFNMDNDGKKESTMEYFYRDVTNFSASTDTVEKEVFEKISCKGEVTYTRKTVDSDRFTIIVPGDKYYCSMERSNYTERAIQGMKAKLREKKI